MVVAIGLAVTGIGTVAMMAVAARALPASEYAGFAVWWTVATLMGTSFGVFEVYLARLVAAARAGGRATDRVTGLMIGRAGSVVLVVGLALLGLAPALADRLFAGHLGPGLLLPIFTGLAAAQCVQRGAASGRRNFVAIAMQLSSDGLFRFTLVGVLVLLDMASLFTLAVACCVSTAVSLVVGGRLCPSWLARPRIRGAEAAIKPLVFLLAGSIGPLLANNGSVPWLAATRSEDAYTLGAFAAAVTLSRIPTQFVSAVFSPLLSHLTETVATGDRVTFQHLRRGAEGTAVVLGALYVIAFAALGPWALSVYLGSGYRLAVVNLALLAAASSVMFVAVVQQAALGAMDRWTRIGAAWGLGTVAFFIVLLMPWDTLLRACLAPLAGVVAASASLAFLSRGVWGLREPRLGSQPKETWDPPR